MQFAALEAFVGGYLHQDWDLEYGTYREAAMAFGTNESLDVVVRAVVEGALLAASMNDDQIAVWLASAGCCVVPPAGTTPTLCLRSTLEEVLVAAADRTPTARYG